MNYNFRVHSRLRLGSDTLELAAIKKPSADFVYYAPHPENLMVLQSAKILSWLMDICSVSVGPIFAKRCPAIVYHAPLAPWHHPKQSSMFVAIDVFKSFRSLRIKKFTTSETFHFDYVVVRCG